MEADKEDFDPVGKGHLLALHIMLKGFQGGALFGVCIIAPFMAWRLRHRPGELAAKLPNAFAISAVTGTALAGALGAARLYDQTPESIEERVYRLHYNRGQNRTDIFALVSALVGGVAAGALLGRRPVTLAAGATAGAAVGVLAHVATFRDEEEAYLGAKLQELKEEQQEEQEMLKGAARSKK